MHNNQPFPMNIHNKHTVVCELVDWCFTARQHKIGQFAPIPGGITGSGV